MNRHSFLKKALMAIAVSLVPKILQPVVPTKIIRYGKLTWDKDHMKLPPDFDPKVCTPDVEIDMTLFNKDRIIYHLKPESAYENILQLYKEMRYPK